MVTYIFNGECQQSIKQAFIDTYLPKLELVVETTADYKKSGIYSAERNYASVPIVIDWGDGTVERVDGDISQKVHEYATVGTFNVVVKNIKSYAASINDRTWYNTTSQNARTLKEVIAIPDSVTSIGSSAFYNCSGLKSVTIGNGVTGIWSYTFYNCGGLTSVMIPDGVTIIEEHAFSGCSGLTSVTIPDSVTSIRASAFSGCSGLTSVMIGNGVTSIRDHAFRDCGSLTSISVGAGNTNYTSVNGLLLSKASKTLIRSVNSQVTIPDSVTSIGEYAFSRCTNLTSVTIPDSVTSIRASAFSVCSGLTSVTILNSVTSIGSYAFWSCGKLTSVMIGSGVTSIGSSAFSGCSRLTSVVFEGKTLAEVQAMSNYPWGITNTSIITVI